MNYIVSIFALICLNTVVFSQTSVDKGSVQIKVAKGVFMGKILTSYNFNESSSLQNGGGNNFGAFQNRLTIHYNTHKNFSLGIDFLGHTIDGDSANYNSGGFGILAQYYFVNNPKMNIYVEANMGGINAYWKNKDELQPASLDGQGSYNSFSFGINKYFGNVIGLYFQGGFMGQGIRIKTFTNNGVNEDYFGNIKTEDVKFLMRGGYTNIGLTIKLRNKTPKSE